MSREECLKINKRVLLDKVNSTKVVLRQCTLLLIKALYKAFDFLNKKI